MYDIRNLKLSDDMSLCHYNVVHLRNITQQPTRLLDKPRTPTLVVAIAVCYAIVFY